MIKDFDAIQIKLFVMNELKIYYSSQFGREKTERKKSGKKRKRYKGCNFSIIPFNKYWNYYFVGKGNAGKEI